MRKETIEFEGGNYLSDLITELPAHCIINKGITGCGGTTLELKSKRDSIILCPTKNLVTSKSSLGYFGVIGDVTQTDIKNYLITEKSYKKIVATYDALEKLMNAIPNYQEYFLLVDEYHLLFNDYNFRSDAIMFVLNNFRNFNNWAFMTATPLKEEFILDELKDVDQITYVWKHSIPVSIDIRDEYQIQKKLFEYIETFKDRNLHIFLNSVSTIYKICEKLDDSIYRVVCSENSKAKISNFAKITDPVRKINFYTSCAFEGCDIYDPDGYCIIMCDTNIATTVLDIATKIKQVCGRLRDSKYKDKVTLILNTNKHRYAGTSKTEFFKQVAESEEFGHAKISLLNKANEKEYRSELRTFNRGTYGSIYVNKYKDKIFFDENLKKLDIYNYNLISEIYNSTISVISECKKHNIKPIVSKSNWEFGLTWVTDKLRELDRSEFTYPELEEIFTPLFKEHSLKWNKITSIKNFFPKHTKKKKMVNSKIDTYYHFDLKNKTQTS